MSENARVTKAAGVVGFSTFLSRIFGYIRDMVFAWFFGAGPISDAFIAAFRIPNLFRRLFGEGSLSIALVPVFTEYLTLDGKQEALKLAGSALRVLSILLAVTAVMGIVFAPLIMKAIAYGFTDSPRQFSLTVTLTRIMFPYMVFICLVAFSMGILNALGHFAAPALAPVLLNLAMIGSMVLVSFLSDDMTYRIYGLAAGVLVGGLLQLCLQIPFLIEKGFLFWRKASLYHPGLKRIGTLMIPATFGAAVFQINTLIQTFLASLLPEGSISYLYYADRLVQFPLALFGIATATAVLPSLSRQASEKDFEGVKATFVYAINLVFYITVPSMVGLIVLREPIVALLFKRGAFGGEATKLTAYALLYYAIGLWAFSGVRIVISTFYALQDTKTPVKVAIVAIMANIVLGRLLMVPMGHGGLALALSLSMIINFALLIRALRARLGALGLSGIGGSLLKTVFCSVLMGVAVHLTEVYIISSDYRSLSELVVGLAISILIGFSLYAVFSFLVQSRELKTIVSIVRKDFFKKWT
ncbi:MAG: murein biosynthesis integral membrane protein MurJ [Deltaproteobacteria bacterium]|nr:murein biosynthesis integral membrane protein MurJ [Deltaproteobacteria bacterium]MBW1960987.1 murein biosynthesis integral membrane protein MurJ [Deltaproteobacteria bacterium]MBW1994573.1 murein biosynthesis integral membrane protein MurJ [Deltaproteobacteria bacterium]MBW2151550.1 murein biosynthesis integral membrane protein MurJ [Deltaproteobacteria bacterium]